MFSDIHTILKKSFHERIILLILYLEKCSKIKWPFKVIRKIILQILYHCEIHPDSFRDKEAIVTCCMPHPYLIVIHRKASLGANMRIFQGVTIGIIEKGNNISAPYFEDSVYIGVKASILGGVTIGRNAKIGAHALVMGNVKPGDTVCGFFK